MKIQEVPIDKLKPDPNNPNEMSPSELRKLVESIQKWGQVYNVVANRDYTIIGGHHTIEACRVLGIKKVPVHFVDVPKDEAPLLSVALNKIKGRLTPFKLDKVIQRARRTKLGRKKIHLTGFDHSELDRIHRAVNKAKEQPEVKFSKELGEANNFVVLFFKTEIDWAQFESLFTLPRVHDIKSRPGFEKKGIGRVISGPEFLDKVLGKKPWRKGK